MVGLQTLVGLARSALISLGEVTLYLLKPSGYQLMFSAQYLLLFHLQIFAKQRKQRLSFMAGLLGMIFISVVGVNQDLC